MLPSKGHIQPHHANLPRRHPRTRLPRTSSRTGGNLDHVAVPRSTEHAPTTTGPVAASTSSTKSTETGTSTGQYNPVLPHTRSFTPVTSPLDPPPEKFPLPLPSQRQKSIDAAVGPTPPLADDQDPHPLANASPDAVKFCFASPSTTRGHLEPRVTNLPRRFSRAQKQKEIVRRRCLQEFLPASGIWVAFDSRTNAGDDDDEGHKLRDGLTSAEKKEHDWMWGEEFGFTGVIRVQIGGNHGKCAKPVGKRDILELVIGREEVRAYDDLGIPVLTEDQLNNTATFFIENHRRWNGKGKLLITTPAQRPVEALSIAFFASSLLSTSTSLPLSSGQPPSVLTDTRLLPGILELKQSQDLDNQDLATDIEVGKCRMRSRLNYTPIHFTLWHIHDLASIDQDDESAGLKPEWRGALSQEGIEKLDSLITLRLTA